MSGPAWSRKHQTVFQLQIAFNLLQRPAVV